MKLASVENSREISFKDQCCKNQESMQDREGIDRS